MYVRRAVSSFRAFASSVSAQKLRPRRTGSDACSVNFDLLRIHLAAPRIASTAFAPSTYISTKAAWSALTNSSGTLGAAGAAFAPPELASHTFGVVLGAALLFLPAGRLEELHHQSHGVARELGLFDQLGDDEPGIFHVADIPGGQFHANEVLQSHRLMNE